MPHQAPLPGVRALHALRGEQRGASRDRLDGGAPALAAVGADEEVRVGDLHPHGPAVLALHHVPAVQLRAALHVARDVRAPRVARGPQRRHPRHVPRVQRGVEPPVKLAQRGDRLLGLILCLWLWLGALGAGVLGDLHPRPVQQLLWEGGQQDVPVGAAGPGATHAPVQPQRDVRALPDVFRGASQQRLEVLVEVEPAAWRGPHQPPL
mmetsp:Transcript_40596/g.102759  ORF Transcript_40596/g.102759 Transcript_40596/m.102759 type:complete len:208 (+) Transcript_40596:437-1060(+)